MFHEIRLRKGGNCHCNHVMTEGMIHDHTMRFCQNTCPSFHVRNTPTPIISDSLGNLEVENHESMCTKVTGGTHTDWTHELRSFANMKLQLPHHWWVSESHLVLAALFSLFTRR